ncbi:putative hydro-lyase [Oscillibacter sp. MSJ-2]|uniref:Putative hydro-lyase KQI82_03110 n=1 Tax=Dysosmobacter acutus TaxID=2841504 RepID=A0ABS6F8L8_9FIRM|nr:putative hydro-lyase [Dysosmobacter acutus]MBU5625927.1 putative hydro-lyase [Dysosmobacter acutus]
MEQNLTPLKVRHMARSGRLTSPTAGLCPGYAQANLIILPGRWARDFREYARRNSAPCPVLEVLEGSPKTRLMASDGDITTDFPAYRIYRGGVLCQEETDVSALWQPDFVGFLIGCSFSFEEALLRAGIEMRHITMGRNVPMYKTSIPTHPAGPFRGPMVCSMRPMTPEHARLAAEITARFPHVHGGPVQIDRPEEIGIPDLSRPDYGDAVEVRPGEVPVFWPCGVTPQAAVEAAKPPIAITHAPGHMFVTDVKNESLGDLLSAHQP